MNPIHDPVSDSGRRRQRDKGHVQRSLDPLGQERGKNDEGRHDGHAAHEERLWIIDNKPREGSDHAGERDDEQEWSLGRLRRVDV